MTQDLWGETVKPDPKAATEFGGVPGLFGNVDMGDPLPPHLEATSSKFTDPADPESAPSHGTAGQPTS
jgi:hypothetical protein